MKTGADLSWDEYYIQMCEVVSRKSKDPSTRVGAVAVDEYNGVIAVGFNGFPPDIEDDERLDDRATKYKMVLHGEDNVIMRSDPNRLRNSTFYTYPFPPCSNCAAKIIGCGAKRVVTIAPTPELADRWNFDLTISMFKEAGVQFDIIEVEL